jgi:hypothetical protein
MGFHHASNYLFLQFVYITTFISLMSDARNHYQERNDIYKVLYLFSYILQKCKRHTIQACVNIKNISKIFRLCKYVYVYIYILSTISLTVNKSELCNAFFLL